MRVSKMQMTAIAATLSTVATTATPATLYEESTITLLSNGSFLNNAHQMLFFDDSLSLNYGLHAQREDHVNSLSWLNQDTWITPFLPQIKATQELQKQIAERHTMSEATHDSRIFVEIRPQGLEVEAQPLTFDHVSGPVGIMRELAKDGATSDYVFAAVGINTDDIIMTQKYTDPNGIYPIGAKVPMNNPDILHSENARVAVAFTQEMGSIQELQFVLPHDADPDEDITISLKNMNGDVTHTIAANDYQIIPANQSRFANVADIGDVPDFLVLVIKNDAENLSIIHDTILGNGSFEVQAISPMGRLVPSPAAFGPDMAAHLNAAYTQLSAPQFYFATPTSDVQRLYSYDPDSEFIGALEKQCVFLGLQDMSETDRSNIRIFNALVEAGTGVRPRDFERGYVAVNQFNELVAAGSAAWLGSNVETQTARVSGSAPTGFLTEGGELLSGCTDDNIVTWSTPVTSTAYNSVTTVTMGGVTSLFTGVTTTRTGITVTPGTNEYPSTPPTAVVPIEGAEWIAVIAAEKIDLATGFTKIASPVRKFFEENWTPLEPGSLLLGSAIGMLFARRRLIHTFTTAKNAIVDTTKMATTSLKTNPAKVIKTVGQSIGLG
jgi:hypothetical protein